MDWFMWLLDKAFVLILLFIGMKLMDRSMRKMIMDTIVFIKGGTLGPDGKPVGGKMPNIKDAIGLVAWNAAPAIGRGLAAKIEAWLGGAPPGKT